LSEKMVTAADNALYRSKGAGRDRVSGQRLQILQS
jgi:PleD family two-component response regulator